ncbi:hypothetical protein [Streptomyces sp. NPDC006446]|uniref:hypothetical protein n=1 Tax=Streptomyces sp. NPDC006446 TaxID=3154301 RepID=UPI0033A0255C
MSVHSQTAWTWAKEGPMPVPVHQTPSGTWLIGEPAPEACGRVPASGRRLVVLDPAETADDLVRDIPKVLTPMCAPLYGRRAAKNRAAPTVVVVTGEAAE